ncbi:bifunctional chorismate synthase/riboflavin reductase [NAD(P)H] aro2, partial [Coemansia sp. RSA 2673]
MGPVGDVAELLERRGELVREPRPLGRRPRVRLDQVRAVSRQRLDFPLVVVHPRQLGRELSRRRVAQYAHVARRVSAQLLGCPPLLRLAALVVPQAVALLWWLDDEAMDNSEITFGTAFRVTTYGESHCKSVGCIIDGVPPGLALSEADIQVQLTRRRPGQSKLTTPRNETDNVTIQSGCEQGFTLGTPICLTVPNQDHRPHDYSETDLYPRPSHADYTYMLKYGIKASAAALVASVTRADVDATAVRCPDAATEALMHDEIVACSAEKNSTGGIVTCVVRN